MAEVTLKTSPFEVMFMTTNPLTGDLLFTGDIINVPEQLITAAQLKDGVFVRLAGEHDDHHEVRDEPSLLRGINISNEEFDAREAAGNLAPHRPPVGGDRKVLRN